MEVTASLDTEPSYYGNGQNVFVPSVTAIISVGLKVDGSNVGQNVSQQLCWSECISIRSEADQLHSESVYVSVADSKWFGNEHAFH